MSKERFDIHQHLTDRIVTAIEAGAGKWQMPLPVRADHHARR